MTFIRQLVRLLVDPVGAISALRASRPLVQSILTAAAVTAVYQAVLAGIVRDLVAIVRLGGFDFGGFAILASHLFRFPAMMMPVVFLLVVYVPVSLLLLGALHPDDRPVDMLKREYRAMAAVTLALWSVTLLVWIVPAGVFSDPAFPQSRMIWIVLPATFFLVPMTVAFAQTANSGYGRGVVAALFGGLSLVLLPFAAWLALVLSSPIVLIITFFIFRNMLREWSRDRDSRERFRQNLEASTLNPADATAHVNLGIIYLEQRDFDRATEHFRRAVEIDPEEIDALYNLGIIARKQGELSEAIARFDSVLQLDPDHANSEVWREVGLTYYTAAQFEDALAALERFTSFRPWDAEGLYLLGMTYDALGQPDRARAQMEAVVDAVQSAPHYKYRLEKKWLREARAYLATHT